MRKTSQEKSRSRPPPVETRAVKDGKKITPSSESSQLIEDLSDLSNLAQPLQINSSANLQRNSSARARQESKDFMCNSVSNGSCGSTSSNDKFATGKRPSGSEGKPGAPAFEQKQMFVDPQEMKRRVRENLAKKSYAVTDYYKQFGLFQAVVRNQKFENSTLAIIALNAIWIAVDTDFNTSEVLLDAHPIFQIAENLFCAYFSYEWVARFCCFKHKRDCVKDAWFVFDSLLVLTMVLETWVMTVVMLSSGGGGGGGMGNASILRIARLLRLSRMARMARLLRAMPELMVLIKGMLAATRSVFFTLCLLILIMYVFAIAFTQLTANTSVGASHFETVPQSMYTLLIHGALLDDVSGLSRILSKSSWLFVFVFFLFSLLAALTVMNMLIGVLCEVVSAVAATEREEMLVTYVNEKLRQVLSIIDTDGDAKISKNEFIKILENMDAARALQEVGVDVVGLIDFADFIFVDDNLDEDGNEVELELDFAQFMEVILQLRGSNNATVKDVVDLRKFISKGMAQHQMHLMNIQKQLAHLTNNDGLHSSNSNNFVAKFSHTKSGEKNNSLLQSQEKHVVAEELKDNISDLLHLHKALSIEKISSQPIKPNANIFDVSAAEGNGNATLVHPMPTPSVAPLFCNDADTSSPDEHTAHDIMSFRGQWVRMQGSPILLEERSNSTEASLPSCPRMPSTSCSKGVEKDSHPPSSDKRDVAISVDELAAKLGIPPAPHKVDALRRQINILGTVLESGVAEYHKLQDWVVKEHGLDACIGSQCTESQTMEKSLNPNRRDDLEKFQQHHFNSRF